MWLENPFWKLELWPFFPRTSFSPLLHWSLFTILQRRLVWFSSIFCTTWTTSLQHSLGVNHFITNNISVSAIPLEAKASRKSQLLFKPLQFNKELCCRGNKNLVRVLLRPREAQLSAVSLTQHRCKQKTKHCCGSPSMLRSKGMYLDHQRSI